MKKIFTELFFYCLLPFAGITYIIFDSYKSLMRRKHRNHLHKIGRTTDYNPYCDKF